MRKQVDFDVRVFPLGNGSNDSMTREQIAQLIRDGYLLRSNENKADKSYWEVFDVNTNQVTAGTIFYQVTLVKYLDAT